MAKRRRVKKRSWGRATFATLWIALAGVSGLYLYTLLTDPAALGGFVQLSADAGDSAAIAPAPQSAPEIVAPPPAADALSKDDVAALESTLQGLSQQVGQIDARLKPIERFIGPVAALPPSNSVSTSPPAPAAAVQPAEEVVAAAPEPEPEPAAEPEPATPPPVAVAEPEPAPEPEPASPETASEAPPSPPEPAEAVEQTEETEVEIATFDPVTLPPDANDGSTRYGIEIGSVAKRDDLRPLWREYLTKHAALVAGLQPRRVLAPDKTWRLIAGPFADAQDAEGACMLFKKADRPCAATVYAGDAL